MTEVCPQNMKWNGTNFFWEFFSIFSRYNNHTTPIAQNDCTLIFLKLIFHIFEMFIFFETVNHRHVKVLEQNREEFHGFVQAGTVTESRGPNKFKTRWPKKWTFDQKNIRPNSTVLNLINITCNRQLSTWRLFIWVFLRT